MPVKRFRSVEAMTPLPDQPFDEHNLRAAFELASLCIGLSGKRPRPGVYKYTSIAAANEARDRWEREPRD